MKKIKRYPVLLICVFTFFFAGNVMAGPIMYVHDSSGNLATVDVQSGAVNMIGNLGVTMTDIGFDPAGNLWGVSFTSFFSIDHTSAATSFIGSHGINNANALVFGADGTAYAAGNTTPNLFTIDTLTGLGTSQGNIGFNSGGDLAFHDGNLYLASSLSSLVLVDLNDLSASFQVGPFGVNNVYGLATGDDGILYGVAGTQIFSVNTATGAATSPVNYGGAGLGTAYGQAFFTEAGAQPDPTPIPAPGPAVLVLLGLLALRLYSPSAWGSAKP